MDQPDVLERLREFLDRAGVAYTVKVHEPTYTSEQSAQARGEPLSIGAKALLVKVDEEFRLFVLPADRKLDSAAARRGLDARKLRFATADELSELTGLVPGSVPPFGRPVLPLDLVVDEALAQNHRVAFNAGSLTTSIVMAAADYLRLCGGQRLVITQGE
jgi:prolyl-tRNA editing enzyme YbaK/EbsC (Cys-tRNA(Pro) deacylase)